MEFDVESFMFDVTAALAHGSPQQLGHRRGNADEDEEATTIENTLGDEPFSAYEEFFQYPLDEHSNAPSVTRCSRRDSVQSVEFLTSTGQDNDLEDADKVKDSPPAYFDFGMFKFLVLDGHGVDIGYTYLS
jgi:hypothetical protein